MLLKKENSAYMLEEKQQSTEFGILFVVFVSASYPWSLPLFLRLL